MTNKIIWAYVNGQPFASAIAENARDAALQIIRDAELGVCPTGPDGNTSYSPFEVREYIMYTNARFFTFVNNRKIPVT